MKAKVVVLDIAQPTPSVSLSSTPYTTNNVAEGMSARNLQFTNAWYYHTMCWYSYAIRKKVPPTNICPHISVIFVPNFGSFKRIGKSRLIILNLSYHMNLWRFLHSHNIQ